MKIKFINSLLIIPVLFLSLFIKRKKTYFSFGDWFGKKNSDSSFYIFKVASKEKQLKVAWITKSDYIFKKLNQENYTCYKANSYKGLLFQLRSWTFISTVNSFDFFPLALVGKKNYIQLGHGLPFKKYFKKKLTKFQKFRFYLRSKTIENYSYYASSSEIFNNITKFQYNVDDSKILEIPPARCDYFRQTNQTDVLKKLNIQDDQVYIAYLPTHRDEGKTIHDIVSNLKLIDEIINELDINFKILFKPHFYDIPSFEKVKFNFNNIIFNPNWDSDELMLVSDLLIGDYSGVVFDYFYLNKYEIGLCTDYESYIKNHRDLYFNLEDIYDNLALNENSLRVMLLKFKNNKLKKTDSLKFVWSKKDDLSFSQIAWKKILKTVI